MSWIRFGLVGLAATIVYYLAGLLLVLRLQLPVWLGNALAYGCGFGVSYLGQVKWTFNARGSHLAMLSRFALTQALGLGANAAIIAICARLAISYQVAMLIAIAIVPAMTYVACRFWVFKTREREAR